MELDVDYVVEDILLQPSPASGNSVSLGKFRPKAHPKSNKSVQAPSEPFVATQVSPITEPPVSVPDPKSPDERSRLPNASINDCLVVASGLDSTQGPICQPEAFPSKPFGSGVNNVETLQCGQEGMEIHSVWNASTLIPKEQVKPLAEVNHGGGNTLLQFFSGFLIVDLLLLQVEAVVVIVGVEHVDKGLPLLNMLMVFSTTEDVSTIGAVVEALVTEPVAYLELPCRKKKLRLSKQGKLQGKEWRTERN